MKIGCDLDDVLLDTMRKYLEFYYYKFGKRVNLQDVRFYNHWENKIIGGTREDAIKNFDDFYSSKFFDGIELMEGVFEMVENLRGWNELFIITSRPLRFREKTDKFLQEYFPGVFKIFYSDDFHKQHNMGKREICVREGINVFIEDNLDYAISCSEEGVNVFLLDKPWNQSNTLPEKVIRVYDWKEVLRGLSGDKNEHK